MSGEHDETLRRIEERLNRIEKLLDEQKSTASKKMMNVDEVSAYTGYVKRYIYHLTGEKRIPHYKRGGKLMFDRDEIDRWLQENRVKTEDEVEREAQRICSIGFRKQDL